MFKVNNNNRGIFYPSYKKLKVMKEILDNNKELRKLYEKSLEILCKDTETTADNHDRFGVGRINIRI